MTTMSTMRHQGEQPGGARRLVDGLHAAGGFRSWRSASPALLGGRPHGAAYPTDPRVGNPTTENKAGGLGFAITCTARHLGARST